MLGLMYLLKFLYMCFQLQENVIDKMKPDDPRSNIFYVYFLHVFKNFQSIMGDGPGRN